MDPQPARIQFILRWFSQPKVRAFGIAIAVLVTLAILQVNNLQQDTPMCELLSGCRLQSEDIQRMQIAFSRAGMSDFEVQEQTILVPTHQHSEYMKVASDSHAIPGNLTDEDSSALSFGPFHTRAQQKAIEQSKKKQQVREMVTRLPFVQQAWFEMDRVDNHNVFQGTRQSAVVMIQAPKNFILSERHLETVSQMIGGAVADLSPEDIVVIDLDKGLVHQFDGDESLMDVATETRLRAQRVAYRNQQNFESRIQEALSDYRGLEVRVNVAIHQVETAQELIALQRAAEQRAAHQRRAQQRLATSLPAPGSNGVVSIDVEPTAVSPPVTLVGHQRNVPQIVPTWEEMISVSIDVPESLVNSMAGPDSVSPRSDASRQLHQQQKSKAAFETIRRDIVSRVRGVLPGNGTAQTHKVAINLIPQPKAAVKDTAWSSGLELIDRHWPSAAVVVIGLTLLMMVTRTSTATPATIASEPREMDVLAMTHADSSANQVEPEVRLSQMIEEDPDAAAKIIETWIRDAA